MKQYYIFAKNHRKHHKGGCIPYESYIYLFQIIKHYWKNKNHQNEKNHTSDYIKILEIGTATGFTSFVMNIACQQNCKIHTIEKNQEHVQIAQNQFKKYKMNNIEIFFGKAEEIFKNLDKNFYDIIFFDAFAPKKENVVEFENLLKTDGILISANSLLKNSDPDYFKNFENKKWIQITKFADTIVYSFKKKN